MRREISGVCNYYALWRKAAKPVVFHIKESKDLYMLKKHMLLDSTMSSKEELYRLALSLDAPDLVSQPITFNQQQSMSGKEEVKHIILLYNKQHPVVLSSNKDNVRQRKPFTNSDFKFIFLYGQINIRRTITISLF